MARPSKTGKRRVQFEIVAAPGSEVFVAGSFNGWDPTATPLRDKDATACTGAHCCWHPAATSTSS